MEKNKKEKNKKNEKKEKTTFKQRIKNFFSLPEQELKEEESEKIFETKKLFSISRGDFFLSILLFLIFVNVLIGFNVDFLYLQPILGFLFIIIIPGLLIMLCFKIRKLGFWEYLVYTIGLSISFIMFAGLFVNWVLPVIGITDNPLSLLPILLSFDIFIFALWFFAIKRNKDIEKFEMKFIELDTINNIFFIIPMVFPILSILGAFLINNHGPNILTMIMLGGIAIYVLLLTIFRKRMDENVWPWALLTIGLTILLNGWLRSWFVSGSDISLEYWVFQLTADNSYWTISGFNNTYNAMLSLNILPTILYNFIQINDQYIFKLIIPLLFSVMIPIIYLISRRILPCTFSFFAGLLFLFMPDFINWASIPIRQEIAFIFFGLMILVLLTKNIGYSIKNFFFVIFGLSMIISHYSTTYIALLIFLLLYIFNTISKIYNKSKIKKGKLPSSENSEIYLRFLPMLLLLIFAFLWYVQVSSTANGLINFAGESMSNLERIFSEDIRGGGATDPIFGVLKKSNIPNILQKYEKENLKYDLSNTSEGFSKESYSNYAVRYLPSESLNSKIDSINISNLNYYIKQVISKIFQFFILFGLIYILRIKRINKEMKNLFIVTSFIIFIFLFLPLFTIYYNITRFIQQILIILVPLSIFGGKVLFEKIKVNSSLALASLLVLFLLFFSGFASQLYGGDVAKMQLNNFGWDYNANYMFTQDYYGAGWLDNYNTFNNRVYADAIANLKLNSYGGRLNDAKVNRNLIPMRITKQSYVYLSTINNIKNMGVFSISGVKMSYNFPIIFLEDNKNKVYNNGGSEIFK